MTKLSAPGLYDAISMDAYVGDLCVGPSISGSGLHKIDNRCPAVWWAGSYLNPEREADDDTPAKEFGKQVHMLFLEGMEAFNAHHVIKPDGMSFSTKEGKAWREANGDKTIITAPDWQIIKAMWKALQSDPMASKVFSDGKPEQTLVWQDQATGVWLKARPDWLPNKLRVVPNYKTALSAKPAEWSRQASNLGYHQSAALLVDGLRAVLDWDAAVPYWVVQEKTPPYVVELFTMTPEAIEWGRLQNRRSIDLFARCLETGAWPKYTDKVTEIGLPAWAERTLEKRHEAGEFAGAPLQTGIAA